MSDDEIINIDDMNYAVYKIGSWKNNYEINQIGISREIPVTKHTLNHVKLSMDEIRSSEFEISDKSVNGFVAIALQLNPKVQEMDLDDVIELEEKELETEDYLIYKLEKDCHVTNSIPANKFTKKFYLDEMRRIEDALS